MKKFGLFLSISLLFAFTGCNDDDTEEPVVQAVSKPVVAITENTSNSFSVEWDAVAQAEEYLYSVSKEDAQGNASEVYPETRTSATKLTVSDASAATKYTVRVQSIASAESNLADSDFAEIFIVTPAEGQTAQTFAFGTPTVTYSSITMSIEPAVAEDSYYAAAVKTSLLLDKNSNEIINMVKADIEESTLKKGNQTLTFEQLDPSTNYTVVAFGYDAAKGSSTSVLYRSEQVETAADTRASFELSILSTGDTSVSAKCVPSDAQVSYYLAVVPATEVAGKNDYTVLDEQIAKLNKQSWDVISGQLRQGTSTLSATNLTMGTEYYVVAFGLQRSVSGTAEAATRLFKVGVETTKPEPIVAIEYSVEDGDNYMDPEAAGRAIVMIRLTPNAATVKFGYGLYYETFLNLTEEEQILTMTGDPGQFETEAVEGGYIIDWGERLCLAAVGIDATGETGPISKELIVVEKDNIGGGGDDGGDTDPVERSEASVTINVKASNGCSDADIPVGTPTLILGCTPSSDCASYRVMPAMNEGTLEDFGEDELIKAFADKTYENDLWFSGEEIGSGAVFSFKVGILGQTVETIAIGYDAEGRPGKLTMVATTYPSSLDDLEQLSRPFVPSSSFLSTSLNLKSKMDLVKKLEPFKMTRL